MLVRVTIFFLVRPRDVPDECLRHFHRSKYIEPKDCFPIFVVGASKTAEGEPVFGKTPITHRACRVEQHVDRRTVELSSKSIDGGVILDIK